ncbi:hypothetical protein ABE099_18045 [Paenibacillus turicensis]
MRKYWASIIVVSILSSMVLINSNNPETGQKPVYPVAKLMSTTSNGEGS